ncbi:outer membrane beta-barrel protein [Geothrix sp. 21YS21S-2]|uniref:outer membrane beta-barrel protein n=1 Tax=Geothrix sp. 21YS21S-2 TaxID=3068893 RepID=UPI0027B89034|nr:outer membrane beta-barrel protein [Geothrix sp. 21YS21S-2]
MTTSTSRLARLGLLCAAATVLGAEAPRLGLTAGAAWPTGGTRDHITESAGCTVGAFADWEQRPGHAIRLALDGNFHPRSSSRLAPGYGGRGEAQSQSLTLNYVFKPRADFQGFFIVLGAGGMNVQRRQGNFLYETGVKLSWNAGFGVDMNERWGLLARYHSISTEGRNLGTVTAGLTYRF